MTSHALPLGAPTSTSRRPFVIVTGDLVRTGGMDRANLALASYLAASGHDVHAVAHRVDPQLLSDPHLQFHRVPKPANSYLFGGPLLNRAGIRVGKQVADQGGHVVVNGGNCNFGDVNWVHYVHAAYTPFAAGGFVRRAKTAWTHRSFRSAETKCLKSARLVIANSDRTKADLVNRVGVNGDRIHTVYYGNDATAFAPPTIAERAMLRERLGWPADRPVVTFIGALGDRRKGFDTLFAAWSTLCQDAGWDADLVVVGQGAELNAWQERASGANMKSRIRFLGFRRDVPDLLRAADVLVAPTRYEAYGLGVQEALCCGLPAIVSADAGVAERYPLGLQSLLLNDCEDAADLARRLTIWRANADQLRIAAAKIGEQMRERSWDQMASDIAQLASRND